jgi:hypothetical protein
MATCPQCGQELSIFTRHLLTGACRKCGAGGYPHGTLGCGSLISAHWRMALVASVLFGGVVGFGVHSVGISVRDARFTPLFNPWRPPRQIDDMGAVNVSLFGHRLYSEGVPAEAMEGRRQALNWFILIGLGVGGAAVGLLLFLIPWRRSCNDSADV